MTLTELRADPDYQAAAKAEHDRIEDLFAEWSGESEHLIDAIVSGWGLERARVEWERRKRERLRGNVGRGSDTGRQHDAATFQTLAK
jgi:hypothetical protein